MRKRKHYPGEEVAEKMKFVTAAVEFAIAITGKDGRRHDRGNFSYRVKKIPTLLIGFGGNTAEIWYHPKSQYEEGIPPVLETWWQFDVEKCQHKLDSDRRWQYELRGEIKRHDEAVVRAGRIAAAPKKKELTKYEKEVHEQNLARKIDGKYDL